MLAAAFPGQTRDDLAGLSIGQRDALLLTLREQTFGSRLTGLADCQGCKNQVEFVFGVPDILVCSPGCPSPSEEESQERIEALALCLADHEVRFRLPNSLDLAAVAEAEDVAVTRRRLLERCLLVVRRDGEERSADQLPADVAQAIVERMAQADPQADVQLVLSCPQCGHQWQAPFDIVSFFWTEIDAWAIRTLRDVHVLASAYGWREADILGMTPWRRHRYLELVAG
jgi:hypothetical protein